MYGGLNAVMYASAPYCPNIHFQHHKCRLHNSQLYSAILCVCSARVYYTFYLEVSGGAITTTVTTAAAAIEKYGFYPLQLRRKG